MDLVLLILFGFFGGGMAAHVTPGLAAVLTEGAIGTGVLFQDNYFFVHA